MEEEQFISTIESYFVSRVGEEVVVYDKKVFEISRQTRVDSSDGIQKLDDSISLEVISPLDFTLQFKFIDGHIEILNAQNSKAVYDFIKSATLQRIYGGIGVNCNIVLIAMALISNAKKQFILLNERPANCEHFFDKVDAYASKDRSKHFAVIPIFSKGHVDLMFCDPRSGDKALFDVSGDYETDTDRAELYKNMFGDDAVVPNNFSFLHNGTYLQAGGTCGLWAIAAAQASLRYNSLEDIKESARNGIFQVEAAKIITDIMNTTKTPFIKIVNIGTEIDQLERYEKHTKGDKDIYVLKNCTHPAVDLAALNYFLSPERFPKPEFHTSNSGQSRNSEQLYGLTYDGLAFRHLKMESLSKQEIEMAIRLPNGESAHLPQLSCIREPSLSFCPESQIATISFKTNDARIFKDIEEVRITLPKNVELNQEYINNLYNAIMSKGFANDYISLDCVEIREKGETDYKPLGKFTNDVIGFRYKQTTADKFRTN